MYPARYQCCYCNNTGLFALVGQYWHERHYCSQMMYLNTFQPMQIQFPYKHISLVPRNEATNTSPSMLHHIFLQHGEVIFPGSYSLIHLYLIIPCETVICTMGIQLNKYQWYSSSCLPFQYFQLHQWLYRCAVQHHMTTVCHGWQSVRIHSQSSYSHR